MIRAMPPADQRGKLPEHPLATGREVLLTGLASSLGIDWRRLGALGVLLAVDWLAVLGCLALVWRLRERLLTLHSPELGPLYPFSAYLENLYFLLPWTIAFAEAGLYNRRTLFWEEVRQVLRGCSLAALFAVFLSFAVQQAQDLSRLVIMGTWAATLVVVPVVRYNTKRLLVMAGLWGKRVLILGAGVTGEEIVERIRAHVALGYEPVGFVDDDPEKIGGCCHGVPVHGPLRAVPKLVRELQVKDVLIAMPHLPREQLLHVISICEGHVESIRVVPDMFGLATVGVETEDLDGLLLLHIRWNLAKPWNLALKRAFDLTVAAATTVVILPLLLVAALAIRFDSPGAVFFAQDRLGRHGRRFRCLKFRTMYVDNEGRLAGHLAADPEARSEWERFAKLKSRDPRITRVGRVLRRFSFDEIPQILNVFKGEMSLVGPRPYLPRERERMGDFAETILKAAPGITGLWQVSGRNEVTFEQRLRLDEYYVRNWSLWMDVIVLVKTLGVVLRGDGAY
jgi:Undecaprenyl-phosphate galactose phosphotransferase WbaP